MSKKWEYCIEWINPAEDTVLQLNKFGSLGWELVETYESWGIFKRERTQEEDIRKATE